MNSPQMITLAHAAAHYDISYTTIWSAVRDGHLPAERFRSRWRVTMPDLEAWMKADPSYATTKRDSEN